ncbi:unnamed protein product [Blepharisma stoltei]|uniref:Uncharacterized protein n=1 Tax=Blepharisma stoltei TaxID=1481888 RepID=A0AAU9IM60_9CILI|nr:unnamed protein product [Blepharisma stoltei]
MNNKSKGCCSCFKAMFSSRPKSIKNNKSDNTAAAKSPQKTQPTEEASNKSPEAKEKRNPNSKLGKNNKKAKTGRLIVNAETFPLDESSISLRISNDISISNDVLFYDKNSIGNQSVDPEQIRCNLDAAFHIMQDALNTSFINSNYLDSDGKEPFTKVVKNINFKELLKDEEISISRDSNNEKISS